MSAAQKFIAAVAAQLVCEPDSLASVTLYATPLGNVVITRLWIAPAERRQGHGTRVLRWCTELADLHQVPLKVRARPLERVAGGMTARKLAAWFASHSFEADGDAGRMSRRPQASARPA